MALIRWLGDEGMFTRLERMRREMDRLTSAFGPHFGAGEGTVYRPGVYPPINVYDDGESFIVRAEVPGADPKAMDLTVTGDTLTIRGERVAAELPEGASYHRRELNTGQFRRALTLPEQVDNSKVMASYRDGILEIRMPRAEQAKQRKIEIKSS
jgi:HSP20 family protein